MGPGRLWFTPGYGTVNGLCYPRADIPQNRDLDFFPAEGKGLWCDIRVKRLDNDSLDVPAPGIPAPTIVQRRR